MNVNAKRLDGFGSFKCRITEDAVVGTNGKIELEHGCAETGEGSIIENDVFQKRSTRHLGLVITAN